MGESILARVTDAVVDALAANRADVVPGASLLLDLGADSLDRVQLAMQLEDEFNLKAGIPDADMHALATVQDVVDYVTRRCETEAA